MTIKIKYHTIVGSTSSGSTLFATHPTILHHLMITHNIIFHEEKKKTINVSKTYFPHHENIPV